MQFRERFPKIQLTLTKLRSLKRNMVKILVMDMKVDPVVAAFSHVLFERLVLGGHINKENRRVMAAVSMLLALKQLVDSAKDLMEDFFEAVIQQWSNLTKLIVRKFDVYFSDLLI